jgi:sugar transferase (PEP-CTERM/EpsH1 system associated)
MGQYAEGLQIAQGGARVIDFCDVDSDKWQQYAGASGSLIGRVFAREAENLRDYEQRYLRNFDATLVISSTEASILSEGAGDAASKIKVVPNGVNTRYFDPELRFPSPFASGRPAMVFTGAMDYNANVDGVCWFVEAVLPQIRRQVRASRALESNSGVVVTGRVPDVRPFLTHAAVVVAPLRIARGVQNKVLEGLAMSRPIVATPNALQGIPNADRAGVRVAANDDEFSTEVTRIIRSPREQPQGREFVRAEYCWDRHMSPVRELFRNRL